jgi:hypothetical protein
MSRSAKWELTQQSTLCSGDIVHPAGVRAPRATVDAAVGTLRKRKLEDLGDGAVLFAACRVGRTTMTGRAGVSDARR